MPRYRTAPPPHLPRSESDLRFGIAPPSRLASTRLRRAKRKRLPWKDSAPRSCWRTPVRLFSSSTQTARPDDLSARPSSMTLTAPKIRVLIVDDHVPVAERLYALLSRDEGFEVTELAHAANEAFR